MDLINEDAKIIKAALYYAAGLISTLPQWEDQNPNKVVNWLLSMAKDDFELLGRSIPDALTCDFSKDSANSDKATLAEKFLNQSTDV